MELHYYKPTDLETWISKKYQENGIHYASDLDIDHIASIFNITVKTTKEESKALWDEDYSLILLHGYLTEEQKREHFFQELCHPITHVWKSKLHAAGFPRTSRDPGSPLSTVRGYTSLFN